ncbi:unnamed protein product [Hymenolepis diminuta]|uniref:Uncharacterized protein n=1 Tax=Hymenolepis diminuta TaxID=6216 RepID=A0A564Z2A1_HYMDI|nr:unnamed protein product [Hymenolepis diminuta]
MSDNLTFCAEMPDEGSYGRAFWRVTYTCHLQSFENDWQLIEKYLPKMSATTRADLKHTTGILMQKYYSNENSLRKGDRFPFHTTNGDNKLVGSNSDGYKFACLRIPRRHAQMVLDLAKYWCEHGADQPVIVVPSNKSCGGDIISLVNHPSFLCSWDGVDLGVFFLPSFNHFFINKIANSYENKLCLNFPTKDELGILLPTGEMHVLEQDTLVNPKKNREPFQNISLPKSLATPIKMEAVTGIFNSVIKCLHNEEKSKMINKHGKRLGQIVRSPSR